MPSRVATGPRTYDLLGFGPQYGDELVIFGHRKLRHPPGLLALPPRNALFVSVNIAFSARSPNGAEQCFGNVGRQ